MSHSQETTNLRILIIDDNPEIHKDFNKILTKETNTESLLDDFEQRIFGDTNKNKSILPLFHIDTASQGQEGVQCVKRGLEEGNSYALAFVDIRMPPGWDGIETIKHIWQLDPDIQVVICTAYSDYSWEDTVYALGQKENLLILKKPFDSVAVRQLACALTKKWQLMQDARNYTRMLKKEVQDRTASLQESLSLVKATLESSNDGILVVSNQGNIIDYNQKFINMWQISKATIADKDGKELRQFMRNQLIDADSYLESLEKLDANLDIIKVDTIYFKDGRIFEYYTQPQKINMETVGRVFDFRDITKRVKLEKNLEHQATHDFLTGLPNRIMLLNRIKQAIQTSKQNHTIFALLFLDLDRFKIINDSLSHAIGDEVLKITASRLKTVLCSEDTLARLGGDEFVIILPNLSNKNDVLEKLQQLHQIFHEPFKVDNRDVIITTSIGVSFYPNDGMTADILLRNADAAMYRAKEQRSNSFQFYTDELNTKSLEKLDQEMQMRHGLANNEFFLCYQPQVDLSDGKIVAVEALLRWQHPTLGVLLPLDFIQMAEETGLILPLGAWVLEKACTQNKLWQKQGLPPIRIAVNVTAQQFSHQNIVKLVSDVLNQTGLSPKYLELELTENVLVSNVEIIKSMMELKKLGVTLAIDDFGTGYSSLSYLKKIPLDRLKIDSSFIQNIKSATDDEVIIRAVIAMAKNLNLEVLTEGVETKNQLNFLRKHQCGDVQGFYFSKPLTSDELEDYLKNPENVKKLSIEENS